MRINSKFSHQARGGLARRKETVTPYTAGPGGMHCSCCGCGNPRSAKPLHRRMVRRRENQNLRIEVFHKEV